MEDLDNLYMSDPKAKTVSGFIEALTILAKYMREGMDAAHFTAAEHDILYVMTQEELEKNSSDGHRLIALGWHLDDDGSWAYFT